MAEYVHPDVEAIRGNPIADATEYLVIVPKDGQLESAVNMVQELGGTVEERVPLDMLKADIPQSAIDELAGCDEIQAIHLDDEMEVLAPGNP
jgi:hypothetical protein